MEGNVLCTLNRPDKEPVTRFDRFIWHVLAELGNLLSMLIRQLLRFAVQKVASDPRSKEIALKAARGAADQAKHIARQDDKAFAAGRALRRVLNGQSGNSGPGNDKGR